jgi:hypothetical protein
MGVSMKRFVLLLLMVSLVAAQTPTLYSGQEERVMQEIRDANEQYSLGLTEEELLMVEECLTTEMCAFMAKEELQTEIDALMGMYLQYSLASEEDKPVIEGQMRDILEQMRDKIPQLAVKYTDTEEVTAPTQEDLDGLRDELGPGADEIIDNVVENATIYRDRVVYDVTDRQTLRKSALTRYTLRSEQKANIVERIPKKVAQTAGELRFSKTPIILKDDPVVEWTLDVGEEVSYYAEGDKSDVDMPAPVAYKRGAAEMELPLGLIGAGVVVFLVLVAVVGFFAMKKK